MMDLSFLLQFLPELFFKIAILYSVYYSTSWVLDKIEDIFKRERVVIEMVAGLTAYVAELQGRVAVLKAGAAAAEAAVPAAAAG